MPTSPGSPSSSSRAATAAIISAGVYAGLEAVVHPARVAFLRLEPGDQRRLFRHVRRAVGRSEEHTSELQSQSNLVCRLLLEKKNEQIVMHLLVAMCPKPQPPPAQPD